MSPRLTVSDIADIPGRVGEYRREQEDQDCKYGPAASNVLLIHFHFASSTVHLRFTA